MQDNSKYERGLVDPVKEFKNPEKILEDRDLNAEQKLAILKLWAHDAKLLEIADEENMAGGPQDILERIINCINKIKSSL